MDSFDIVIIGAGPAGLFAACQAARLKARTVLLESGDEAGRKLLLTGKGRCNFTQEGLSAQNLQEVFGPKGRFLHSGLAAFGAEAIRRFFDERGLPSVVERGKRVFPARGDARSVRDLLLSEARKSGVRLLTRCPVKALTAEGDTIVAAETDSGPVRGKAFIVTTGGCSYPRTGSTGDGFRWARDLAIDVVPPRPSIVPIKTAEPWSHDLDGQILKNVGLTLFRNGRRLEDRFGEMQFTPFGVSGPIAMDLSRAVGTALEKGGAVRLTIDLKPALNAEKLEARILRDLDKLRGRPVGALLAGLLPRALISPVAQKAGLEKVKPLQGFTREERKNLVATLKGLPLTPTGLLGFDWALVTAGGVSLKALDPRTLRAKAWRNLHFAGEVIDLDGPTGGYNLQVCWSTAYLAGLAAARSLED